MAAMNNNHRGVYDDLEQTYFLETGDKMEKKKQLYNLFASSAFILLCIVLVFIAIPNEIEVSGTLGSSSTVTNSRFFPYVVSIFIGAIALIEFIVALIKYIKLCVKEDKDQAVEKKNVSILRVVFVGGLFALYVFLFSKIGFIFATAIVLPVVLFVMGSRKWYHYTILYGVAAITYVLFKFVLHVSI